MVRQLAALRSELCLRYAIVGVGGVMRPEHADAYRAAGADAVMSATGAMWNPLLAQEVKLHGFTDSVSPKMVFRGAEPRTAPLSGTGAWVKKTLHG